MATEAPDLLEWLPWLLQTGDALFPVGAYAHSLGFEGSVQLGSLRNAGDLLNYLTDRIVPALRDFELPYLRYAYDAARDGDAAELTALEAEIGASKLACETREASLQLGGRRLSGLRVLFPENELLATLPGRHQLTVCAAQAVASGAPLRAALLAYYYQTIAAVGAAAMKLLRVGQEGVQRVLTEVNRGAGDVVAASLAVRREQAGWFDPILEVASMRHERAEERLFIS